MATFDGTSGSDVLRDGNGDDLLRAHDGNDTLYASAGNDDLFGGVGNDALYAGTGDDVLNGGDGDDTLFALNANGMTGLYGGTGNDVMVASVPGTGQIHVGGGVGNDVLRFDLTNSSTTWITNSFGMHAYGDTGADRFEFTNTAAVQSPVFCRLDDFDPGQDTIWVNGQRIDLANLPSNMDVVLYDLDPTDALVDPQQWLRIDDRIMICLDGARDGGRETHFPVADGTPATSSELAALTPVAYVNPLNHVPYALYSARLGTLNEITDRNGDADFDPVTSGTANADLIVAEFSDDETRNDDTINGLEGNDVIDAGKGYDSVSGGLGDDLVAGGLDNDRINGGDGNDRLYGGGENDVVNGEGGNDLLYGSFGRDALNGGTGNDLLDGGDGNDTLAGNSGADTLIGGAGNDQLVGGSENDVLNGGASSDTLNGSVGQDAMSGGIGGDSFVFAATGDSGASATSADRITDFGTGDHVVLTAMDANASLAGDQAFVLDANGNFGAGEIRQTVQGTALLLEFNTDTDSSAEMAILLQNRTAFLVAGDFEL